MLFVLCCQPQATPRRTCCAPQTYGNRQSDVRLRTEVTQSELEEQYRRSEAQTGNWRHRKEVPRGRTDSNLCRCGRSFRIDIFQPCCTGDAGDCARASPGCCSRPRLRHRRADTAPAALASHIPGTAPLAGGQGVSAARSHPDAGTSAPGGAARPGTATGAFYAWTRAEVAAAASLQSCEQTGRTRGSSQRLALSSDSREVAMAKRRL